MRSTRQQARAAGLLYLLMGLTAPLGLLYVPAKIMVSGDATATADNIRNAGGLVRAGIASELFHQILAVFLVLALYELFKGVNERRARQVVILGALLSVPIMFLNVVNDLAALVLVSGADFLSVFDKGQLDALAYLFAHLHAQGVTVASIFWGLWLFPFGMLVIASGFIPRAFGILLILAGIGYLLNSFAGLIVPLHAPLVSQLTGPLAFCELPIIFYLAIWGARTTPGAVAA